MSGSKWTKDEDDMIRRMRLKGMSYFHIGVIMGRSENAVRKRAFAVIPRNEDCEARQSTLCWDCINAVPDPEKHHGCSWSIMFLPVPGWDAIYAPVRAYVGNEATTTESYIVKKCPMFEEG